MDFRGKTVAITGGGSGVGLATAKRFYQLGASVAICGRNKEKLKDAGVFFEDDNRFLAEICDVSDERQVNDFVLKVVEKFNKIDVLVNNAAVSLVSKMHQTSLEDWNRVMSVNSTGVFLMSRAVVKDFIEKKTSGKIVSISSIIGKTGSQMATAYGASKAAVIGFTKCLAKELAPYLINVNCICPGGIDTDMFQKDTVDVIAGKFGVDREKILESSISQIPLKRLLNASEVAELAVYLSSEEASGVTGVSWDIACGYNIN